MPIIDNASRETFSIPGIRHQTYAHGGDGLESLEVWSQTIDAGAATPVHYHECEEVIVILKGSGTLTLDGEDAAFGPESTLIVPPRAEHIIANTGADPIVLIAVFSQTPAATFLPGGIRVPLPWQPS